MIPDVVFDDEGWPVMQWFGESWGAPVCTDMRHAETPIGEDCAEGCGHAIAEGDQGILVALLSDHAPVYLVHHRTCWLKRVLGTKEPV